MDRAFAYIGQSIYEWMFTKQAQNAMVADAKLAAAILGTSTLANGLPCAPTSPASLQVQVGAGEIYQLSSLEATVMGTLPPDTSDIIVKQGVNLGNSLLICSPPVTSGQSINYLIEAQYQDQDVSIDPTTGSPNVVLSFFNAAAPTVPWSGPNNSGVSSNTFRNGVVALQAKAGVAATTGTQTTPTADAGWVGLYVVTVANGATTITSGNISQAPGAPFLTERLTDKISLATGDARYLQITTGQAGTNTYAVASGGPNAFTAALSPAPATLTDGMRVTLLFPLTNTVAGPTLNLNGFGVKTIYEADGTTPVPIGLLPLNAMLVYHTAGGGSWVVISAAPLTTGVVSFNSRTGAVSLTSADVAAALSYTPLDAAGSVASTGKQTFFASTTGSASINIPQGAIPTSPANGDIWTTSTGVFARIAGSTQQLASISGAVTSFNTRSGAVTLTSGDVATALTYTPMNPAGSTMTGELVTVASNTTNAGLNIPHGAAPTTPTNGDFWTTTAGVFARVNGATQPLIGAPGTATVVGDFAVWNNTGGTLLKDVAAASAAQITAGTDNASPVTSLSLANASSEVTLTDAATINWNMAQGFNANVTLGGNRTVATPTNPIVGRTYALRVIQPASGGPWVLTWSGAFDWMGVGAPVLSTAANARDFIALYCESPTKFVATCIKGT